MASVAKRPVPFSKWFWFASLLGCTPGFKKSRCKKLLKVTMSRIKLLKGRREVQVRQLRRDVAQLLQLGQEENAESRLDRLWKEHSLLSAYIKTGEYCQLVKANLQNIAGQRECPMDLKESLASLCFAASCCADLPELQEIRDIMVSKYGKDFLTSAHELLPGEHVNKLFLEAFSTKLPLEVSKKALLKGIIAEYNVVQPRKPKLSCIGGGLQHAGHEGGSNSENGKQCPILNALEQEEKHKKNPKQVRHTTSLRNCRAFAGEHASLQHVEENWDRKRVGPDREEQNDSCFQVQGGVNECDVGSQDRLLRALPHERHGKEKSKSRLKASEEKARVNQAGQRDQHTSSSRMSIHENSGPDEAATGVMHGYGNSPNEKSSLNKVKGFVSEQHREQKHGDFYAQAKHKENKPSNQERLAETNQQALMSQPSKHGYHGEALSEDFNARQMLQQENLYHKKHDYIEREVYSRSNAKVRSEVVRHAFDNVEYEKKFCHKDFDPEETKSKHFSRSNKTDRFRNELDNDQQEKLTRRRNHHVEGGTKVDNKQAKKSLHRRKNHHVEGETGFDETLGMGEAAYGSDYWQSPFTCKVDLPEERSHHADFEHGEAKHKHNSRSDGKSRPDRVTNELDNVRSPLKRNHHVGENIRFEKSGAETYEIESLHVPLKRDGPPTDCGDDIHKVQREKKHSSIANHENDSTTALPGDHSNAHMLQKGRKQHVRKHYFNGSQQEEASANYSEVVVPERATNQSPRLHIHAADKQYDSKYSARQTDRNLNLMENHQTADKTKSCWDFEEARQTGSGTEPCVDGEHLPRDRGHAKQKHRRLARKHDRDHANSTVKILDGDTEQKHEKIEGEAVNGHTYWLHCTNGPHIPEDGSNYVAQIERAHFPRWHHQFDPTPKGFESSIDVEAGSLPQFHNAHSMQKEWKHSEGLDEHEDFVVKLSSCEEFKSNSSPSRFSKPPQRPPPPVPTHRVSSMPNRKALNRPSVLLQRCATLETGCARENQEPHVHPKLPEYEDLVASFAALRNKSGRPPA